MSIVPTYSLIDSLYSIQRCYSECLLSTHHVRVRSCLGDRFLSHSSQWTVHRSDAPFKRRVTCVEWHPIYHNAVAFGSHAGDILLWKYEANSSGLVTTSDSSNSLLEGIGYGFGSVTSMKFHPSNSSCIYATSVDGTFRLRDFTGKKSMVFLDTNDFHFWWVSFDFCLDCNVLFVGDNRGKGVLLSTKGEVIKEFKRLHRGKIKHAEFCPSQSWTLITSSIDHTVAVWDIRMLREESGTSTNTLYKPLAVLDHSAVVSAAHFDPLSGTRLLTTSQNGELRVYDSHNLWEQPTMITEHAHRHFQHLTDITATWHPLYDNLSVVGRYPRATDEDQTRTVDLVNLETGERDGFFYSSFLSGIMPVNKFNKTGEALATGEGSRVVIWKAQAEVLCQGKEGKSDNPKGPRVVPGMNGSSGTMSSRKRREQKKKDDDITRRKLKQKLSETHCDTITKKRRKQ